MNTVQELIDTLVSDYQMTLQDAQTAVQRRLANTGYRNTMPADPVRPQDVQRILLGAAYHYTGTTP